jgi:alpha-methylacyl-CoA racemase
MLLADLGADVVRVDRPADTVRASRDGAQVLNRGKRSIALDLKQPAGIDALRALATNADVLIEPFRPGVAERLGIGPEPLLRAQPRLVYARMTGWGQDGPLAATAGHDVGYLARTGLLHAIGPAESPTIPLALLGDFAGGALYLVIGILAALREAENSGRGQVVDGAIVDGAAHLGTLVFGMLAAGRWRDERAANLMDGGTPFYSVYETADGGHLAVGPIEPAFYREFVTRLGFAPDELPNRQDRSTWPALRARLAERIRSRTRDDWAAVFAGSDACVEPILSLTEALHDEHLGARGTFVDVDGVSQPAPAPRLSRTPGRIGRSPAAPGEHTQEVLREWAGP